LSRWFRHYAGMMRDDKLVRIAIRTKQPIERIVWIWGAVLESAAEIDDAGRYDVDAAEVAYFLRTDEADICAVLAAFADAGHVAGDHVVKWGDRQFISDRSNTRVAAHRERKRAEKAGGNDLPPTGNGDVTLQERDRNAPETETELEKERTPPTPRAGGRSGKHLLPKDWQIPTVADLPPKARACAEQWTPASYATHGEAFVSYWVGEGKMKSDWRGTWANRVVALHSQVLRDQKFGNAPTEANGKQAPPAFQTDDEWNAHCDKMAEGFRRTGRERDAVEWERKRKGIGPPRREATGPPRPIGKLIEQPLSH
jgi:hypothetical protein